MVTPCLLADMFAGASDLQLVTIANRWHAESRLMPSGPDRLAAIRVGRLAMNTYSLRRCEPRERTALTRDRDELCAALGIPVERLAAAVEYAA